MKALIVVDYQKDFVDGALGFVGAELLEKPICEKIDAFRADGAVIIFTFDTHSANYSETYEGKRLPVPHCIEGSDGWELYGELNSHVRDTDIRLKKPTFGSLELGDILRKGGFDEVELVGLVSNICVISNAIIARAALPEAKIIVWRELTAGGNKALNDAALDVLEGMFIDIG